MDGKKILTEKPILKIKKLSKDAVIPSNATPGSAGLDLTAVSRSSTICTTGALAEYGFGLALEIPKGYMGLIFPRSSISPKTSLSLTNSVGLIDEDYRGEIKARFRDHNDFLGNKIYDIGDRVAQLVIVPVTSLEIEEVEELSSTVRGKGGFGSTDNL